jgi:hypothetical protein
VVAVEIVVRSRLAPPEKVLVVLVVVLVLAAELVVEAWEAVEAVEAVEVEAWEAVDVEVDEAVLKAPVAVLERSAPESALSDL